MRLYSHTNQSSITNLLSTLSKNPKKGEIWIVSFDPQTGSEISKTRPAIVVSINDIGVLPLRVLVPLTTFAPYQEKGSYFVIMEPNINNRLLSRSTADCLQIKSFSIERFQKKVGILSTQELVLIEDAIALVLGL